MGWPEGSKVFKRQGKGGRAMEFGTVRGVLIQFGLKDLSELPSIEDFQDLAGGVV